MLISDWSSDVCSSDLRFIDVRAAVEHDAVDRHLLAGPHAQAIANAHVFERDIVFLIAGIEPMRLRRRQREQRADRAGGLRARAQFEYLAEQCGRRDRSDERRVGKGCVSKCRSGWHPSHTHKKRRHTISSEMKVLCIHTTESL